MARSEVRRKADSHTPRKGTLEPLVSDVPSVDRLCNPDAVAPSADGQQHSGRVHRPLHEIRRTAVTAADAKTALERY